MTSRHHRVRQRAQCCLLSHKGYSIDRLASIFQVTRLTITNWLNDWDKFALVGLYEACAPSFGGRPGRGRKPKLTPQQQHQVKTWAKETPKNLDLVQNKIESKWRTQVSKDTIKRILNCLGLTWRRIKKQVAGELDPLIYKAKVEELTKLKNRDRAGEIDLRYVDETGFCLEPYVPYAWQEKGEQIRVNSQRSNRLNVFGILNRRQELEVFLFDGSINSDVVIACIDRCSDRLEMETVLVIDNASIHTRAFRGKLPPKTSLTSNAFLEKQAEWILIIGFGRLSNAPIRQLGLYLCLNVGWLLAKPAVGIRTFGWFNWSRRLSKDYEILTDTSEAFLYIAMIRLSLRRLA